MKYLDKNGEVINYGDILKCIGLENEPKTENSCKTPFCMLCKYDGKDMIYVSGIDEYFEINDMKLPTDKINELKNLEIFAHRVIYEGVLNNDQ